MKVKRFMSAIRAINFLIGMTIHFGMEIMLQILTEVVLFYIFVQKNVRKNIRVVLTAMSSKVTYNVSPLLVSCGLWNRVFSVIENEVMKKKRTFYRKVRNCE